MKRAFRIRPKAARDLRNIARYTLQTWGRQQRNTYLRAIDKRFSWPQQRRKRSVGRPSILHVAPGGGVHSEEAPEPVAVAHQQGKLILDATVAEQAIRYPTDLSLLNEARQFSERIIDLLYPQTCAEIGHETFTFIYIWVLVYCSA